MRMRRRRNKTFCCSVIRETYQMLGEDAHGKAKDMFEMMDK